MATLFLGLATFFLEIHFLEFENSRTWKFFWKSDVEKLVDKIYPMTLYKIISQAKYLKLISEMKKMKEELKKLKS